MMGKRLFARVGVSLATRALAVAWLSCTWVACGDERIPSHSSDAPSDASRPRDAHTITDATRDAEPGTKSDDGATSDAEPFDSLDAPDGARSDDATAEAGSLPPPPDAEATTDAEGNADADADVAVDADTSQDAAADAASLDLGVGDAGAEDAGVGDRGTTDAEAIATDATLADVQAIDAWNPDAAVADTAVADATVLDAATSDGGVPSAFVLGPADFAVAEVSYRSQVIARSPAGGPITYALDQGPDGFSLDAHSGEIVWVPPRAAAGPNAVVIAVSDGTTVERQTFSITVGTTREIASELITTSGGGAITVLATGTHLDGMTLEFPPGAILEDTVVSIAIVDGVLPPTSGQIRIGESFIVLPEGLEFVESPTLTYHVDERFLPPGMDITHVYPEFHDTRPEAFDGEIAYIENMHTRAIDLIANTLNVFPPKTAIVSSFSGAPVLLQFVRTIVVAANTLTSTLAFDVWVSADTPMGARTGLADAFETALVYYTTRGFVLPRHGELRVEPFPARLSQTDGYVVWDDPTVVHLNTYVLDAAYEHVRIEAILAHELFHVIQAERLGGSILLNRDYSNDWIFEATATYMQDRFDPTNSYLHSVRFFNTFTHRSLKLFNNQHEYMAMVYFKYLAGTFGFDTGSFWKNLVAGLFYVENGVYLSIGKVLVDRHGTTFEDTFVDFVHQYNLVREENGVYDGTIEDFEEILDNSYMPPPEPRKIDDTRPDLDDAPMKYLPISGRSYHIRVQSDPEVERVRLERKDGGSLVTVVVRDQPGGAIAAYSTGEEFVELESPIERDLYIDVVNTSEEDAWTASLTLKFPVYTLISVETCDTTNADGVSTFEDHVGERYFERTCNDLANHKYVFGNSPNCDNRPAAKMSVCVSKFTACEAPICTDEEATVCDIRDYHTTEEGIAARCREAPADTDGVLFDNYNTQGVSNGPSSPTVFSIGRAYRVTHLKTYHYVHPQGTTPGTLALRHSDGTVFGPWQTYGTVGQDGVPNADWHCDPNIEIHAGSYTVVDSDPSTWSYNGQSRSGFARVEGVPW